MLTLVDIGRNTEFDTNLKLGLYETAFIRDARVDTVCEHRHHYIIGHFIWACWFDGDTYTGKRSRYVYYE